MNEKRILLIIGGGIAAYKCLDLIRRLRDEGISVRVVMTKAATQFITPLTVGALSNDKVFTDLFDLNDEREIGHIRLSREADLLVVAPATANLMAKMAAGLADDLASTLLLATDKPVLVAPAMNPKMWTHPATRRNRAQLEEDGITFVGPAHGEMAESNEAGFGRLAELPDLVAAIKQMLDTDTGALTSQNHGALNGRHLLITAGPTHEPIDPVRYLANRSSGKQGYAIARAAAAAGASVTLISGPTQLPDPANVTTVRVETADQMLKAARAALPADAAIFTAAVADWRAKKPATDKLKKRRKGRNPKTGKEIALEGPISLDLVENRDILKTIASSPGARPKLVVGFAAETKNVIDFAAAKLASKGCDWIVANDVSPGTGVMGGDRNKVHIINGAGVESLPKMSKDEVARQLIARVAIALGGRADD